MVQSSERTSIRTPSEIHMRSIVCEMGETSGGLGSGVTVLAVIGQSRLPIFTKIK